jgi:hypothetical protein
MSPDPAPPSGLGTPGAGQPEFVAPSGTPSVESGAPAATRPVPPILPPPDPATRVPAPPVGRRHAEPRRGRRAVVALVLAGGLLLIGILSALPLVPAALPSPGPVATPSPTVVTVNPAPASAATRTLTSGGGLGTPIAFRSATGAGTLTVTRATWTDAGDAPPPEGHRYLVLDIRIDCTAGTVPVSPVLLLVTAGDAAEFPGFGPALARPLAGRELTKGGHAEGQLGYVVPPGSVQLHLLDEELRRLAGVEVPPP